MIWKIDHYGDLKLAWDPPADFEMTKRAVLDFFRSSGWVNTLPKAYRRYRLTTPQDMADYPDYHNVQLVDVPTFKGLEAGGVVFILHDFFAPYEFQLQQRLYVAFSRPKHLLHIVGPYSLIAKAGSYRKVG